VTNHFIIYSFGVIQV